MWTPPVLADHTSACDAGGAPQRKGADYTSQSGRTFHVWAPAGYDASKRWPIVFMFHGWYADGKAFESWFQMENYVNGEAIVVYPDAVNGLWDLNGESDLSFFDEMTKQVGETYCADPRHTYAFGFSYGGKFTNHLACARAGYIRAASIGDGSEGGSYKHCGRLPILFTHRTHDQDEQIAWSRANQRTWVGLDGCSAETDLTNAELSCVTNRGCQSPATLTFCEDTWFDPNWPADWNHTVREPYRAFAWNWLKAH